MARATSTAAVARGDALFHPDDAPSTSTTAAVAPASSSAAALAVASSRAKREGDAYGRETEDTRTARRCHLRPPAPSKRERDGDAARGHETARSPAAYAARSVDYGPIRNEGRREEDARPEATGRIVEGRRNRWRRSRRDGPGLDVRRSARIDERAADETKRRSLSPHRAAFRRARLPSSEFGVWHGAFFGDARRKTTLKARGFGRSSRLGGALGLERRSALAASRRGRRRAEGDGKGHRVRR
mmetsp:Transcript_39223/g.83748  ORF Transcript_39223/g.83748 Transcript_39223/m.83748 type:complete len:243 (+) Transcript_39223:443-1171(+)